MTAEGGGDAKVPPADLVGRLITMGGAAALGAAAATGTGAADLVGRVMTMGAGFAGDG